MSPVYAFTTNFIIFFAQTPSNKPLQLSLRFLSFFLWDVKCRLPACPYFKCPLPVLINRLAAAFFVLIPRDGTKIVANSDEVEDCDEDCCKVLILRAALCTCKGPMVNNDLLGVNRNDELILNCCKETGWTLCWTIVAGAFMMAARTNMPVRRPRVANMSRYWRIDHTVRFYKNK